MLGNGRLEAMCFDGQKRLCHIRCQTVDNFFFFVADNGTKINKEFVQESLTEPEGLLQFSLLR